VLGQNSKINIRRKTGKATKLTLCKVMAVLTVLCATETLSKENKYGRNIKAKLNKPLESVQIFTELGRNKTGCKTYCSVRQ